MNAKIEGTVNLDKIAIAGIKIGDWRDISISVVNHSMPEDSVTIVFTGNNGHRSLEMAQIYIDAEGKVSLTKPIYRYKHDHDDVEKTGKLCKKDGKTPVTIFPQVSSY